jgi:hypothetical protein
MGYKARLSYWLSTGCFLQVEQEIKAITSTATPLIGNRTVFPIALLQEFDAGTEMSGVDAYVQ